MSRFAQAASFALPLAGDLNAQSPLLRNTAHMDPHAAPQPTRPPLGAPSGGFGPDPYGGYAPVGLPPGPGAAGAAGFAASRWPKAMPPDPYASSVRLGMPPSLPGAPPDPYAMTSFTSLGRIRKI